ncbi:GPW/gp25 family protein [Paenibacillus sp. NRS-1760]|uniref:GPW/gp25 family protein n=1 Tax=Paenibacillus sp. NRS-1760 TaxID=3233902 RepID=UPI003D2E697F
MSIVINMDEITSINFAPSPSEELIQNVRTILSTLQGSVPIERDFGIDSSIIDEPIQIAKARLTSLIYEAITKYEPRVNIELIEFEDDLFNGILVPIVHLGEVIG